MSKLAASIITLALLASCSGIYGASESTEPGPDGSSPEATSDADAGGPPEAEADARPPPPPPRNETTWVASYPAAQFASTAHAVRADGAVVLAYLYDSVPGYPAPTNAAGVAIEMHDAAGRRLWGKGFLVRAGSSGGGTFLQAGFDATGDILAGTSRANIDSDRV